MFTDDSFEKKGFDVETFGAESNVAYTVYGIDDMNDLNNMMLWMEGGYYHNKEDAIAEAKEWWDSRNTLPLDEGGGVVKVWVSKPLKKMVLLMKWKKLFLTGLKPLRLKQSIQDCMGRKQNVPLVVNSSKVMS